MFFKNQAYKYCISLLFIVIASFSTALNAAGVDSQAQKNKALVWQYLNAIGTDEQASVSASTFAKDYYEIRAEFENLYYNIQESALAADAEPLEQAIPDRKDTIELVIAEQDTVVVKYKISGTHKGNLYGIPATDKSFDIYAVSIYNLADGKIINGWHMADEIALLRQLGKPMPAREDGQYRIPPTGGKNAVAADDILAAMLANPEDSKAYRNKLNVASRKANNPPAGYKKKSEGLSYDEILRYGFQNVTDIGNETNQAHLSFGKAFSNRIDKLDYFMIDGDWIFIRFRLTANNTASLFGLPPTNQPVNAWETAFMKFDNERWRTAWWFGDDQSLLMQLNGPQSFWFPEQN
jgi:steroid delta-isomerase-like uncharacterized protein